VTHPPRLARVWLRLFVPADLRDSVEGDLLEVFSAHAHTHGRASARIWYWREALSFSIRFTLDRLRRAVRTRGSAHDTSPSAATWLESVGADISFARRLFARRPLSSGTIVLVLAIGIAGCATVYGMLQSAIMRPPPGVPRDVSLVRIRQLERPKDLPFWWRAKFSYLTVREFAALRSVFSAVAGWTETPVILDAPGALDHATANAQFVTDGYFDIVGLRPAYGSLLPNAFPRADGPPLVAVISKSMWEDAFARGEVINARLVVNGVAVRIVGVAPPQFNGVPASYSDVSRLTVWLPLSTRAAILAAGQAGASAAALSSADSTLFHAVGRLAPGVSPERASAAVRVIAANALRQMTPTRSADPNALQAPEMVHDADVLPLQGSAETLALAMGAPPGPGTMAALAAFGTLATLLLLVVCTNVAALFLSASVDRRAEIAVRLSLGASRTRVVRQLLTESVILSAVGGGLGLSLLWGVVAALRRNPTAAYFSPGVGTAAFTLGVALATGIVCGLAPALHATRGGVAAALKQTTSGASRGSRLHRAFVVAQVMLTQPLLMFVGMMIASLLVGVKLRLPNGVDARVLKLDVDVAVMPGPTAMTGAALDRLRARIANVAGVSAVLPEPQVTRRTVLAVRPDDLGSNIAAGASVPSDINMMLPGYFDLRGVPLVRGSDDAMFSDTSASIIIGSELARRLWGDADPIGKRLSERSAPSTRAHDFVVIGVYDSRYFDNGDVQTVFRSVTDMRSAHLLIRSAVPVEALADTIRKVVRQELPLAPIKSLETIEQSESRALRTARELNAGLGACAAFVLLLSSIGLYGSVALGVRQRRREIGVRMALGARAQQVVARFFADGVRLGVFGLLLGLPISIGVSNLLERHATSSHLVIGVVVAGVVLVVASIATLVPASRAAHIDPVTALRNE
jgi:predicted permease